MRTLTPLATGLLLALGATGCEFLATVDRGLIPDGGGSGGGSGGESSSSTSASSSTGGPPVACVLPLDCPGMDSDCTVRTCTAGKCGTASAPQGTPTSMQASGDCQRSVCDGKGGESLVVDDGDVPVDGNPCTDDVCTSGAPSNPPSAGSKPCDEAGGKFCDGLAHCVECVVTAQCSGGLSCFNNRCVTCFDLIVDGTETDLDCGGPSCTPCPAARHCVVPADCQSGVCTATVCQAPSCADHVANGAETDVDCGGTCPAACGPAEGCLVDADCVGGACTAGKCAPSCSDGVKNGAETDVDCGGATCPTCGDGQGCAAVTDCAAPTTCGGGNPGAAGVCGCTADPAATTCAGVECGPVANNCGKPVDCGGCAAPLTCGGGAPGAANHCGCTPDPVAVTCAAAQCGVVSNNCGAPVTCPDTCAAPFTCGSGTPGAPTQCGCPLALGCRLNTTFAKRFGGLLDDDGFALAVSASGILVGGSTSTSTSFGGATLTSAGAKDAVVARLDLAGGHVWSKIFGDSHTQITRALATDPSGNALLAVDFGGNIDFGGGALVTAGGTDVAVAKLDPSGNHLWSKGFGDASPQAIRGLATDALGDVLVTGFYQGSVDFGGGVLASQGLGDIYVLELSPAGATVWSKSFGDATAQTALGIAADAAGNSVITGQISGTVAFGATVLTTAGGGDAFLAAFDPAGAVRWARTYGDAAAQSGNAVALDAAGNVILGGAFKGTINLGGGALTSAAATTNDAFLAKLDALGNHLWSVRFGDTLDQAINGVAVDAAGNVLATGSFNGTFDCGTGPLTSKGATDVFVVKYSPAGLCLQARRYGNSDPGAQTGRAVAADAAGNVYAFGDFTGTLDVDLGPLVTADALLDMFLLKLTP